MEARQQTLPPIGLIVTILVLASSTSIMSTDMYAPSLPDLATEFSTTPTRVKLTISLNMLAFGIAQLIHGPLSDRFGRRPVLLGSLASVIVLSLLCAAAQSINQLIAARVLLGFGAAAEAVVGLAILKDLYNEKQQVKALALLGMVIAITPAIAPILGGYLHVAFGWQSNFFVIAGMAVVSLLAVAFFLPESTTPDVQALQPRRVARNYWQLLHNADFILHCALLGIMFGLILMFVTGAPFVLIVYFGVATEHFGFYQASMVGCFFLGSLVASRLADTMDGGLMMNGGAAIVVAGSALLIILISMQWLTAISFMACFCIMTFGMGPFFAVAPSRALRSITGQAGSASALLSGVEQTLAACAAVAISLLHDDTVRPMALIAAVLTLLLLVLLWKVKRL